MDDKGIATMIAHVMGNQYAIMELLADAHSADEEARVKLLQATIARGQEYASNLLPIYLKATNAGLNPDELSEN